MKLLRILCPGHDPAASSALRDGVAAFNRGLDIRLRFLSIGIEDREITVTDGTSAATQVENELDAFAPDAVVLLGHGAAAVSAATLSARRPMVLARLGSGVRDGPSADAARAVDHLSAVLLVLDDACEAALRAEGLGDRIARVARPDDSGAAGNSDFGRNVIMALRAARARPSGDSTC